MKLKVGYSIALRARRFSRSNFTDLPGGRGLATQLPAGELGEVEDVAMVWASSDEAVATVSSKGVVTGIGAGSCTITCTESSTTSDTFAITVSTDEDQGCIVLMPEGPPGPKTNYTPGNYDSDTD